MDIICTMSCRETCCCCCCYTYNNVNLAYTSEGSDWELTVSWKNSCGSGNLKLLCNNFRTNKQCLQKCLVQRLPSATIFLSMKTIPTFTASHQLDLINRADAPCLPMNSKIWNILGAFLWYPTYLVILISLHPVQRIIQPLLTYLPLLLGSMISITPQNYTWLR